MKLLGKILLSFIALLLIAILLVVMFIDTNSIKPRIEAAAKDQGYALQINGDLGWAFWPSIGITLGDIKVAKVESPTEYIAELHQASLLLALMPLFSGDIQVNHIALDGAQLHLNVDANGKGNWESSTIPPEEKTVPTTAEKNDSNSELSINIEKISVTNTSVVYDNVAAGQNITVHDVNLVMTNVNTQNKPFTLALDWALELKQQNAVPLALTGKLQNQISINKELNNITLNDGDLTLVINHENGAPIALHYNLNLIDPQNAMSYKGDLTLDKLNAKKLLASLGTEIVTANSNALSAVALSTIFTGDAQNIALDALTLQLDTTHLSGTAKTTFNNGAIKLTLQGDAINLDDYLPPEAESSSAEPTATEDTPLPLDSLRTADIDAAFTLGSMRLKKMAMNNIDLRIKAKKGIMTQTLTAKAYKGDVAFNSKTDARSDKALLNFNGDVKGLELSPLLTDMEMSEKLQLSGAIQAQTQGVAQGASVNQLMESMDSTANFSGAQVRLAPLNIEEQFCKAVNLITQNSSEEITWDSFTEMRQLDGKVIWRDQVINLESFDAGVSQLLLTSTGKINLASNKYEFKLPLKLAEASKAASLKGCSLSTSNYWVDRGLSLLRCKGSLATLNPVKDCGFDKGALGSLTKDFAEYKLREKHGAKIDAAEAKLDAKKQELKQQANDKKSDLFNKLQGKLLRTDKASSSAASSTTAQ